MCSTHLGIGGEWYGEPCGEGVNGEPVGYGFK